MRVPKNTNPSKLTNIKHVHVEKPIVIPRLPVITNEKQRVALVKKIESYCRTSMEYKDLITYLRKYVNMDECTFFTNFKAGKRRGMIEVHHCPFTLFYIVDTVMRRHEKQYGYIDEFDVCEEVMRLHYKGLIGLIPLSVTCHQLVHDDRLDIPLWCVYGRFVEFTKMYYKWISDEALAALSEMVKTSRKFKDDPTSLRKNLSILDVNYVYLDVEGEKKMTDSEFATVKNLA